MELPGREPVVDQKSGGRGIAVHTAGVRLSSRVGANFAGFVVQFGGSIVRFGPALAPFLLEGLGEC